jgi:hypothetical protein
MNTGIRTTKALVAMGAISLALVAAGPANAADSAPPVDKNGKKSCSITDTQTGTTRWVPHDTTVIHEFKDGFRQKETCNDGQWEITYMPPPSTTYDLSYTTGTLDGGSSGATTTYRATSGTTGAYSQPSR